MAGLVSANSEHDRPDSRSGRCCLMVIDERGRVDTATGALLPQVTARFGTIAPGSLAPAPRPGWPPPPTAFRTPVALGHGHTADATAVPAPDVGASLVFQLRDPADLRARGHGTTS